MFIIRSKQLESSKTKSKNCSSKWNDFSCRLFITRCRCFCNSYSLLIEMGRKAGAQSRRLSQRLQLGPPRARTPFYLVHAAGAAWLPPISSFYVLHKANNNSFRRRDATHSLTSSTCTENVILERSKQYSSATKSRVGTYQELFHYLGNS